MTAGEIARRQIRSRLYPIAGTRLSCLGGGIAEAKIASITIRNLDDALKRKLRLRAAERNRSMADEALEILRTALAEQSKPSRNLAEAIRRRVEELGGFDLDLPPRGPLREPPEIE